MQENNDKKHNTFNLIPKYRQDYITLRLSWLIELLELNTNHWPIDYIQLLEKIKILQPVPFEYEFIDLPEKFDAITEYVEEYSLYIIFVNKNKVIFPCEHPIHIKLNFAIALELAHIALGHLLIPQILKTPEELNLEKIESHEFASRFLSIKNVPLSCYNDSVILPTEHLNTSKAASWKKTNNLDVNLSNSKLSKIYKKIVNILLLSLLSTIDFTSLLSPVDLIC
jgi:hypothetical protein